MGDAVRDGDVPAELEDTIDAQAPKSEPAPAGLPVEIIAATRDYKELLAVDRHHYAITREIAHGGIGRVFEARDLRLGRQVAIKELLPKNRDAARRFEREARITARLQHPSIIHVYEAGLWPGGEPFYAMPLVAGRSLDKVVAEKKSLPERLALLPNVIAAADALAYAHNANVIHRDLKPANVLVGEFGETVVIDWGLAKDLGTYTDPKESLQMRLRATGEETVSGSVVGTPAYMPPEQARGDAVDQRADVYALGALLYKVLCGAAPYAGKNAGDVLEQVKAGPPVPLQEREPDAPPDLLAIVAKAMARDVDARYITASELAADLKRFETGQLVGAHRYTTGELVRRWLRRHRVAVSIAAVALLVLIGFGVFSVQRIVTEKHRAEEQRATANLARRNLLEERGRAELLGGHAGAALAYLVAAAEDGVTGGARGFLIADAMRPFEASVARVQVGPGDVVVAVSGDGKLIATAGNGDVELHRPDGSPLHSFSTDGVTRVIAFDAQGAQLAAGGNDGVVRVWSLAAMAVPPVELRDHRGAVLTVTFTPDGKRLVTAGIDATVRVWNLATRTHDDVPCHVGPVVSARLSPDGTQVLTASQDTTACIIKLEEVHQVSPRTMRQIKGHNGPVNDAAWSPDGRLIVTASSDGTAKVWSAESGKPVVAALRHEPGTIVQTAAISGDGLVVTAGSDLVARVWELPVLGQEDSTDPRNLKLPRRLVGHTGRIASVVISPDDQDLVTAGFDGLVKLWDLHTGQEIETFEHGDVVSAIAFAPAAHLLASGGADGTARIWRTAQGGDLRRDLDSAVKAIAVAPEFLAPPGSRDIVVAAAREDSVVTLMHVKAAGDGFHVAESQDLPGHIGSVLAAAFAPDGSWLVTAGVDAAAIVWDPRTGKQLRPLGRHTHPTLALAAVDNAHVAMLVDGGIEVWSVVDATQTTLAPLRATVTGIDAIAVSSGGAIAGVSQDGTVAVWTDWTNQSAKPAIASDTGQQYSAVTFAPDGDALVLAGPGGAYMRKLVRANGKLDIGKSEAKFAEGDVGEVRAVLAPDRARVITAGYTGRASIWDRAKGKLLHTRGRHAQAINAMALAGNTLWLASEDHTLSAWNVRSEDGDVASLKKFMRDKHVPVELGPGDVVRKRTK